MVYIYSKFTNEKKFFGNTDPIELTEEYDTPLFVYNENILRSALNDSHQIWKLPEIFEQDILGIMDSGAYGYSMSSNCNNL